MVDLDEFVLFASVIWPHIIVLSASSLKSSPYKLKCNSVLTYAAGVTTSFKDESTSKVHKWSTSEYDHTPKVNLNVFNHITISSSPV